MDGERNCDARDGDSGNFVPDLGDSRIYTDMQRMHAENACTQFADSRMRLIASFDK